MCARRARARACVRVCACVVVLLGSHPHITMCTRRYCAGGGNICDSTTGGAALSAGVGLLILAEGRGFCSELRVGSAFAFVTSTFPFAPQMSPFAPPPPVVPAVCPSYPQPHVW